MTICPTIELLRYTLDIASEATPEPLCLAATAFINRFDEEVGDDADYPERSKFFEEALDLTNQLEAFAILPLILFSVEVDWAKGDPEQGDYGAVVRAWHEDHAILKTRAEMENCDSGEFAYFDGAGVAYPGVIWKAVELEAALRNLVTQVSDEGSHGGDVDDWSCPICSATPAEFMIESTSDKSAIVFLSRNCFGDTFDDPASSPERFAIAYDIEANSYVIRDETMGERGDTYPRYTVSVLKHFLHATPIRRGTRFVVPFED